MANLLHRTGACIARQWPPNKWPFFKFWVIGGLFSFWVWKSVDIQEFARSWVGILGLMIYSYGLSRSAFFARGSFKPAVRTLERWAMMELFFSLPSYVGTSIATYYFNPSVASRNCQICFWLEVALVAYGFLEICFWITVEEIRRRRLGWWKWTGLSRFRILDTLYRWEPITRPKMCVCAQGLLIPRTVSAEEASGKTSGYENDQEWAKNDACDEGKNAAHEKIVNAGDRTDSTDSTGEIVSASLNDRTYADLANAERGAIAS